MNKRDSIQAAKRALEARTILHVRAASGDSYSAGPYTAAIARGVPFVAYGYGRSRFVVAEHRGSAYDVASFLVEQAGRGAVTKAVRDAEARKLNPSARHSR